MLRLAAAITAAALVSACAPGQLPAGPLGARPENHGGVGQPELRGVPDTIGVDVMFNGGPRPAVIDRLVLVSPRHIKLVGAYVYPAARGTFGGWPGFPPRYLRGRPGSEYRGLVWAWAHRHIPAGAIIPPHQWAGVVLGLEATSARGSIASIDVFYHVGSARYEWQGHVRVVLTRVRDLVPPG